MNNNPYQSNKINLDRPKKTILEERSQPLIKEKLLSPLKKVGLKLDDELKNFFKKLSVDEERLLIDTEVEIDGITKKHKDIVKVHREEFWKELYQLNIDIKKFCELWKFRHELYLILKSDPQGNKKDNSTALEKCIEFQGLDIYELSILFIAIISNPNHEEIVFYCNSVGEKVMSFRSCLNAKIKSGNHRISYQRTIYGDFIKVLRGIHAPVIIHAKDYIK